MLKAELKQLKYHFPQLYFWYIKWIKKTKIKELTVVPWMNDKAIDWLKKNLKRDMKIFEYGCGGSTLFMSALTEKVISVEHDPVYYITLKDEIKKGGIKNCKLFFSPPNNGAPKNTIYASTDEKYKNMNFEKYIETINKYPDNYFDLVFIDGRARNGCIVNALPKIKNSGYLLLDNSDRLEYEIGKEKLKKYPRQIFADQTSRLENQHETTIWQINKNI